FVGKGATRFILTYAPEEADSSYGQIIVNVDDYHMINAQIQKIEGYLQGKHPDIRKKIHRFVYGPGEGSKIEMRFSGPDIKVLRNLADQAKEIMASEANAKVVKDDWREKVRVIKVDMDEAKARNVGITRAELNEALAHQLNGTVSGVYREGDDIEPIIVRPPENERRGYDDLKNIQLYSGVTNRYIPIEQVVDGVSVDWEDEIVRRRNRKRTITAQCDQKVGNASVLFAKMKPRLEAIEIPPGYEMEWGGEYESAKDAESKLMAKVPLAFMLMFLISVFLFNTIRHPIIIFLGLPLSVIGVAAGLLLSGVPYGFMALLGFLSLAGMLIKNEIVLLDQINLEMEEGKSPYQAVLDASVSRVRPVAMAAFTTVLGMAPLLFDPFFIGMAVTIMSGLTFATILTLVVIPVLYATFFRVNPEQKQNQN
ncbi:MAG: efflux RND transporter permease subunit, partial [Gammaproteobacteria bacterium]